MLNRIKFSIRMTKELNALGFRVGKERVRKLMQLHGIRDKERRKFVVTTDSNTWVNSYTYI